MFLFINPTQRNTREFVMNRFRPKMPPFGVLYLASTLKTIGVRSVLHDDNLHEYSDDQLKTLFRRYEGETQAVGLPSISTTLKQVKRIARISKEILPEVPIIIGGSHARLLPEDLIKYPEVDVVFTSEAERAIVDYAKGKPLSEIEGIVYRKNGKTSRNPVNSVIKNLDDIPFPDYSLVNIADYHTTKGVTKRHPSSYIITSRGCPYDCTYCSSRALNPENKNAVRFRSPENTLEEIEMLVKKYGVRELFFSDELFTGNRKHLLGICEGIIGMNLDIIWVCMTHVNNIDRQKLRAMKKAGCHQICFGVESGDPGIQREIGKNLDLRRVVEVVRMTQSEGIDARCSFMFGNHNETPETMQRTLDFARSLQPDFASFNIATPYPGTYLRAWAMENGYLENENYDALDSTTYTLATPLLPSGTVEKFCDRAFKSFYYDPAYVFRRLRRLRDKEDMIRYLKSAYYALRAIPFFA